MSLIERSSSLRLDSLGVVQLALRQYGLLGAAARFLTLHDELRRFVARGQTRAARAQRQRILHQADHVFSAGEYAGSLNEVRQIVQRTGELSVCNLVPGWFKDTLPALEVRPAFVFTDVDYVTSARDCLRWLWPRLQPGGQWFTHEASFLTYVEGIMDPDWWMTTLQQPPPVLIGGGAGLSAAAPSLAYFRKKPTPESAREQR